MSILDIFKKNKNKENDGQPSWAGKKGPTENLNSFLSSKAVDEEAIKRPRSVPISSFNEGAFMTTTRYYLPAALLEFINNMDSEISEFVEKNSLDEYNSDYWRKRISDITSLSIAQLDGQKASHETAAKMMTINNSVNLVKLEGELSILEKELDEKERFLEILMEEKTS